jgi:hypothetical protein
VRQAAGQFGSTATATFAEVEGLPRAVTALSERLGELGWAPDLLVGGSLATGDYIPGVSDLDLVAVVVGSIDEERTSRLVRLHEDLDRGLASGSDLGCVYVEASSLTEPAALHPTWTHGELVHRTLSGIRRAELVRHGFAVHGRQPTTLFPPMTDDQIRDAARAELCGYWAWASRRPGMWRYPVIADLGLTSMARGRYTLETGRLLTKSDAIEQAHAPPWLISQLRARRQGESVVSPRLRTGWIAWRDARRTVRAACHVNGG